MNGGRSDTVGSGRVGLGWEWMGTGSPVVRVGCTNAYFRYPPFPCNWAFLLTDSQVWEWVWRGFTARIGGGHFFGMSFRMLESRCYILCRNRKKRYDLMTIRS